MTFISLKAASPFSNFKPAVRIWPRPGLLAKNGWSGQTSEARGPLKPWAMLSEVLPYFDSNVPSAQNAASMVCHLSAERRDLLRADVQFSGRRSMAFSFGQ